MISLTLATSSGCAAVSSANAAGSADRHSSADSIREAHFLSVCFIVFLLSYDAVTAPLIWPLMRYLPMKM